MLKIIVELEDINDKLSAVSDHFDALYEVSWFESDLAKAIIRGIDNSEYIEDECIRSPIFGLIPPKSLSTGCKGCLLVLNQDDLVICGERFGDNCFPWLSEIGKQKDVVITLHHFLRDKSLRFEALILNSNKVVHSTDELNMEILNLGD